jgi:hypothetical protein
MILNIWRYGAMALWRMVKHKKTANPSRRGGSLRRYKAACAPQIVLLQTAHSSLIIKTYVIDHIRGFKRRRFKDFLIKQHRYTLLARC